MDRGILKRAFVAAVLAAAAGLALFWQCPSRVPGGVVLVWAGVIAASGLAAPRIFLVIEKFNGHAVRGIGVALTWILLAGLYWVYFVPGRLVLAALGRDPLGRKFRDGRPTYWEQHRRPGGPDPYRRQY